MITSTPSMYDEKTCMKKMDAQQSAVIATSTRNDIHCRRARFDTGNHTSIGSFTRGAAPSPTSGIFSAEEAAAAAVGVNPDCGRFEGGSSTQRPSSV